MKNIAIISTLVMTVFLSSCNHKDLCYGVEKNSGVEVVYDWRYAPDASPASMGIYLYPQDGGSEIRFVFPNSTGGPISVPAVKYHAVGLNMDNTDWAVFESPEDASAFAISTPDALALEGAGLDALSVPRARESNDERMAKTPGSLWTDRIDGIDLTNTSVSHVITLYPEDRLCHYTVDVYDVENVGSLAGASVDGTLSGMAEAFMVGREETSDNPVTHPFVFTINRDEASLHSQFVTFGETSRTARSHILSLYTIMSDGSKLHYTYDVTDQVSKAPDPRNVHIVVRGLPLPSPFTGGMGLIPDVNDWQSVNITIRM